MLTHRARLAPLQNDTEWTLIDAVLTERRGSRVRTFDLATLARLDLITRPRRGVRLVFGWLSTLIIPSASFTGPGRHEDRSVTFEPLLDAILIQAAQAAPRAHISTGRADPAAALATIAVILGATAIGFAILSATMGAYAIGLALGARMLFAAILLLAIRPWVGRPWRSPTASPST